MKIATAAYPVEWHNRWNDFVGKLRVWVRTASEQGAGILLFPEYAALEIASLAGEENSKDPGRSVDAVVARIGDVDDLHASLAREFGVFICAGSAPVKAGDAGRVNRARIFAPDGSRAHQDKLAPTAYEREVLGMGAGAGLTVFDTALGSLAILIGEDALLPGLGAALAAEAPDLLLVPAQVTMPAEYARLRLGAAARGLECGAAVALSVAVGDSSWLPAVERSVGAAAILVPPGATQEDGILAAGKQGTHGWTTAAIDLAAIRAEADLPPATPVTVQRASLGAPAAAEPEPAPGG